MATVNARKRSDESRSELEAELECLFDRHADHSVIREALERMGDGQGMRPIYTTYPASQSNA